MTHVQSIDSGPPSPTVTPAGATSDRSTSAGLRGAAVRLLGRKRLLAAVGIYRLARGKELRSPYPLGHKLAAWQRGFRAENAKLYEFERNDWRDYVSDYQRVHRCKNINPMPELFANKLLLKTFLQLRGIAQPETVAVANGAMILLDPLEPHARYVSPAEFEQRLLADGGRFIIKQQNGTHGANLYLVRAEGGALVRQRGKRVERFDAASMRGTLLVERMVEQGSFWQALSPASANTLRVLTMWTAGDPAPFVGFAVQRVGTESTAPTDNWSGGGICAAVDLETGRLGVGRMHPTKGDRPETVFTRHPDSGAQIEGAVVPHWSRIREVVLAAAASLPVNRYVGWDVLVDQAGTPVIIEGNSNTDVNLLQVHGGLLRNPAVRRFYERCEVL